jgi:hypothetical protein
VALVDDGAMGEVVDAAVLVVAPQPEDQHRMRLGDLGLLLLRFVGKPARDRLLEVEPVAGSPPPQDRRTGNAHYDAAVQRYLHRT